jgi:hypothetical protein
MHSRTVIGVHAAPKLVYSTSLRLRVFLDAVVATQTSLNLEFLKQAQYFLNERFLSKVEVIDGVEHFLLLHSKASGVELSLFAH